MNDSHYTETWIVSSTANEPSSIRLYDKSYRSRDEINSDANGSYEEYFEKIHYTTDTSIDIFSFPLYNYRPDKYCDRCDSHKRSFLHKISCNRASTFQISVRLQNSKYRRYFSYLNSKFGFKTTKRRKQDH